MHVFPDVPEDCLGPDSNRVPGERAGEFEQVFNRGGVYALRLYDGNDFRIVVVDDWLPCTVNGQLAFAQWRDARYIWVSESYAALWSFVGFSFQTSKRKD